MAQQPQPAAQLYMGSVSCYVGAVWNTETTHNGESSQTTVFKCLIRTDAELAKVQNEEPGARKPHAGICTGGALQRAALP